MQNYSVFTILDFTVEGIVELSRFLKIVRFFGPVKNDGDSGRCCLVKHVRKKSQYEENEYHSYTKKKHLLLVAEWFSKRYHL